MTWLTWGLKVPAASASERLVIGGGGRLFVLGADHRRATQAERLDERWSVTAIELRADTPRPKRGDVVVWRWNVDAFESHTWSAPTRVLSVREVDAERVEVHTLNDVHADEQFPEEYAEWFEASFATDSVIAPSEEWDLLACWGLHPLCPRCGATSRPYVYGMPSPGYFDNEEVILGGCVVDEAAPSHRCSGCGHDFQGA